jgi:hypothetical protein
MFGSQHIAHFTHDRANTKGFSISAVGQTKDIDCQVRLGAIHIGEGKGGNVLRVCVPVDSEERNEK